MQGLSMHQSSEPHHFPEQVEHQLKCPRCGSTNTKFCYYNNYNLSQPRHLCKSCKRYWTKGGTLRNIPIGGASRKNTKRSSNVKRCSSSSNNPVSSSAPSNFSHGSNPAPKPETSTLPALSMVDLMMNVSGSFGSLLGSDHVQFGSNTPESFNHNPSLGTGLESVMGQNPSLVLQGGNATHGHGLWEIIHRGDSNCWDAICSNGWADLAIHTPGSSALQHIQSDNQVNAD